MTTIFTFVFWERQHKVMLEVGMALSTCLAPNLPVAHMSKIAARQLTATLPVVIPANFMAISSILTCTILVRFSPCNRDC